MTEVDIDALLNEADNMHRWEQDKLEHPVVKSWSDYEEAEVEPFYVVVHGNVLDQQRDVIDPEVRKRVENELREIKDRGSFVNAGPFQLALGAPRNRPVLVCGGFDTICVREQYEILVKAGYDAYLSKEGTIPFQAVKETTSIPSTTAK